MMSNAAPGRHRLVLEPDILGCDVPSHMWTRRLEPEEPAGPATMSADQRDRLIVMLNDKGWDAGKIGGAVGLTKRGVQMALQRIREGRPGRIRAE
jgi:hypothetical protein